MAFPTNPSEIFINPTLQSASHILSTHLHKQPPSSSHLQSLLTLLHRSLIQILQKNLSFATQESTHLLTQLKDVAYAADDLVDELEYVALQQEVEEFNRLNPNDHNAGPSIPRFRGYQTGKFDIRNGDGDGVSKMASVPVPDSLPAEVDLVEAQVICEDATEDRIIEIIEKLDYFAAYFENAADCYLSNAGVVSEPVTNEAVDEAVQQEFGEFNGDDSARVSVNHGEDHEECHHITIREKRRGILRSKFKSLASAISKMCSCLNGKGDREKTSSPSSLAPVHELSEDKDDDKVFKVGGEVYWGDFEREQLVRMLLEPGEENVSVVPIIGSGGVGKTTLAHYVYSDERVEEYFDTREWVSASDTFDMMRVAGELEESLYLSGPFDELQLLDLYDRNFLKELKGKRFLVVLDDVRSVEWVRRFGVIDAVVKGSKILLTSQEETVLDEEGKRNKIVLKGMRGKEFWALFKKCSFGDEDPNKHPDLESIGRGIAEKLEGSPLAAKMVGGALRGKLDYEHWMSILRNGLLDLGKTCGDVMPHLKLSYQHLPIYLQRCFAYCSVFPKGYAFEIDKLVHIWIAQGLIQPANRMEEVGCEYFDHLLSMSFFELPSYTKSYWRSKYYLMHGLLHDLAESICFNDSLVYRGQDLGVIVKGVRHLSISVSAGLNSKFEWKNLRTLIINTNHVMKLEMLKRVRVLDISHSYMRQLPDSIGCLIHLRYLNLSGNYIYSLPESLCKLYHLQSLTVPHRCHRLPKGITNLVNLRHLNASEEAISWIAGIGRLTCLHELKVFNVKRLKGHDIGQLEGMKELQGRLCIQCLDDVKSKEEVLQANLKDKVHIRELQLKWMRWNRNRKPDAHKDVLECLKPPLGLRELEIHWYRGLQSPSWFEEQSLQNLRLLYLRSCEKWKRLPSLGKLPFLEVLKLEGMDAVVEVIVEQVKVFPSLKELWLKDNSLMFEGMPIVSEHSPKCFPCLRKLTIQKCKMVKGLPPISMLQTLEELDVSECPDVDAEMPGCLINLTSLVTLKISKLQLISFPGEILQWLKHLEIDSCQNLTSWLVNENEGRLSCLTSLCITDTLFPTGPILKKYLTSLHKLSINRCSKLNSFTVEQQKWFRELTLLRELSITDCENLRSLPRDLHHLSSLVKFTVAGCPAIRSLPSGLPASLKTLEFSNCNPGLAALWEDGRAPDWVTRVPYKYIG